MTERPLFRTPVEVSPLPHPIGVGERSVFLGSCFAEHVGGCFRETRLRALVNPLGVMYNPLSIVRLLTTQQADASHDFVFHQGMWHTWLGDSALSRLSREECQSATDEALSRLHAALAEADRLFLTLGTSHYYTYVKEGFEPVANCHRVPSSHFREAELSLEEAVTSLGGALRALRARNPRLQVVLTVSPYRYQKYGFHESQLSKSRLLLAVDALCKAHPDWVSYFPAYEIVLDELRDYRFYADDMLHPSAEAVRYVWQRLTEAWFDGEARAYLRRWQPLQRALQHRPLHPESPDYAAFRQQALRQLAQLQTDYPMLRIEELKD